MKNGYLLITCYLLLITPESPCVHGGEYVNLIQARQYLDAFALVMR
ncbi:MULTISPECIES: hypothetical protein [unclassified Anabaena]|nr:hypothetical protein [Anabaena sp. UHCC 0399]MEA5565145.1 hypothetical protein [Anabaena sp. UHCC 0399]